MRPFMFIRSNFLNAHDCNPAKNTMPMAMHWLHCHNDNAHVCGSLRLPTHQNFLLVAAQLPASSVTAQMLPKWSPSFT